MIGRPCAPPHADPRFRPWYAAAASGPKDVMIVIDTSGSMGGEREEMARSAAKKIVNTLTDADYVSLVKFSSSAEAYSTSLVSANAANKFSMERWIEQNVDAAGTTNFVAAFDKTWEVVDGSAASSNCNRVVLFLSDGAPNDNWVESSYDTVKAKAASYDPPMHILTYALGDSAPTEVLQRIACENKGIFYPVNPSNIANTMASYFQVLAPMMEPCKTRWVRYNDYYTGKELLAACLASFEKPASAATSCNGGLSGLGEAGDCTVPKLLGVGCIDMNVVVDLDVLQDHTGYAAFNSAVEADMAACPRLSITEDQLQTLRALTGASSVCAASPSTCDEIPSPGGATNSTGTEEAIGAAIGGAIGGIVVVLIIIGIICYCKKKSASKPPAAAVAPPATQMQSAQAYGGYAPQPQPVAQPYGAPPVQGMVAAGQPAPVQGQVLMGRVVG